MKINNVEIKENRVVKVFINGVTDVGVILSTTRDGFWFKGDQIDRFIKNTEVNPDLEYNTGNSINSVKEDDASN